MGPTATLISGGARLHLQHGPIDLIIGADGQRQAAFEAARARFDTILAELVAELPLLRGPDSERLSECQGATARRMKHAAEPFLRYGFLTPMICVAGAVADEVLGAMTQAARLDRAYVNNGGDIALHLSEGTRFRTLMRGVDGRDLGRIEIAHKDPVRGIATSGRHGRSHSLGVADSVTVLAAAAASADAAATMIANAVDLSGNPLIARKPAHEMDPDSDLGGRPVVVGCAQLTGDQKDEALGRGMVRALDMQSRDTISEAALFLQGHVMTTRTQLIKTQMLERLDA